MRAYIGVTDQKWYEFLKKHENLEEINFWQPGGKQQFKYLKQGELFLFKLHSPNNYIAGGGFFVHSSLLPINLAWESFGVANGAPTFSEMYSRVAQYRNQPYLHAVNFTIGCIILSQPFFLEEWNWIPVPKDWPSNITGRGYDLESEPGRTLLRQLQASMSGSGIVRENRARYGEPTTYIPRLGQGAFRVLVTDAYDRRCAITNERTLPALDAAHIVPYSSNGEHIVKNGVLLRKDIHALFDEGYITVTPSLSVEVSRKIKEEYENGRDYYRLHGGNIRIPLDPMNMPSKDFLQWHNENVYRG